MNEMVNSGFGGDEMALAARGERTPEVVALEIRALQRQAQGVVLGYAIEIGRRLTEAKALVAYGEWGDWLKTELDYSASTAQNFMKVFREYGDNQQSLFGGVAKSQALGNLSYTKALRLLAIPEEEREEFVEQNDVAAMSTRELDEAIKARDAALAEAKHANERADLLLANFEDARRETERMRESSENARRLYAEVQEVLTKAESDRRAAEVERREAERRVEALRKEIAELKARPPEVTVETVIDQDAVEKARSQAAEEMREKLERAKAARSKAEEKQKAAEDALTAAEARMKELEETSAKELEAARTAGEDRLRALEKQLAAADPDTAQFKVYFTGWQEEYNKMSGVLMKIALADGEKAAKLRGAVSAALENMRGLAV